jgi:hypothetical protein
VPSVLQNDDALRSRQQVIYVAVPDMQGSWIQLGCGIFIGLWLFLIPDIICLIAALLGGERFKDAECAITNHRIIVSRWSNNRDLVSLDLGEIAPVF